MKKILSVNWTGAHEMYQGVYEHNTSHGHGVKTGK